MEILVLIAALETYFRPKGKIKSVQELVQEMQEKESSSDTVEQNLTLEIFRASLAPDQKLHLQQSQSS